MIAVYRNLNKAKRNPRRFVWSIAGTTNTGNRAKLQRHADTVTVINPRAVIKPGGLARIISTGHREVAAWIVGDESPTVAGTRHLITMNPTSPTRGGRADSVFHYCTMNGETLEIGAPVNFSELIAIEFTPTGAYGVKRTNP